MSKLKKVKKWEARARHHAERAEAALDAIQQLVASPAKKKKSQPTYTAPQGRDSLAPAATVS